MITLRGRALALLAVVATSAGCAGDPAAMDPASSLTSRASTSSPASSTAVTTTSTRSARPTASSSATSSGTASSSAVSSSAVSTSSAVSRPSVSSSAPRAAGHVPPISAKARAVGLVDIRTVVPDAIVELRYATTDNFVGVPMYPAGARCLVHESMAPGLKVAAARLRREGLVVVFWDCYRPRAVQARMFDVVSDPQWVARPGPYATSHEAGRSVDITLAHSNPGRRCPAAQRVQRRCLLDMGTDFDHFSPRAHAFANDGVSQRTRANRARLRTAMSSGGITVYSGEWWHFNGPDSGVRRPHLNAPLS